VCWSPTAFKRGYSIEGFQWGNFEEVGVLPRISNILRLSTHLGKSIEHILDTFTGKRFSPYKLAKSELIDLSLFGSFSWTPSGLF
jgi:hypothetical protein